MFVILRIFNHIRLVLLKHKGTVLLSSGVFLLSLSLSLFQKDNPIQQFLSPLVSSNASLIPNISFSKDSYQTFSFAPGWSDNKLGQVRLDGLNALSYFDVPVNADGTLNKNSKGYKNFRSKKSADLFSKAHDNNIRVVVTLTPTDREALVRLLRDRSAQEKLVDETFEAMQEVTIDGVNIAFEFNEKDGVIYKDKLTEFASFFANELKRKRKDSIFSITLSDKNLNDPIYDLPKLMHVVDLVFAQAVTYAVPESTTTSLENPIFGYNASEYWSHVSQSFTKLLSIVPQNKLIVETAWYGNGNNYPLYKLKNIHDDGSNRNTLKTPLSREKIEKIVKQVPKKRQDAVRKNLPLIARALEDEQILNDRVLAYALATIEHETAGTFEPIEEIKGERSAKRLGYEGGTNYFGRGFIQLTHLRNYKKMGERIGRGDELVKNPDLALKADISAKILAAFFKDNNIAHLATKGDFIRARIPVNPDGFARSIARLASKYLRG